MYLPIVNNYFRGTVNFRYWKKIAKIKSRKNVAIKNAKFTLYNKKYN